MNCRVPLRWHASEGDQLDGDLLDGDLLDGDHLDGDRFKETRTKTQNDYTGLILVFDYRE